MAFHQPVLIQPATGDPSLVTTGQEFRNYTAGLLSANIGLPFNSALSGGGVPDAGWAGGGLTGSCVVSQRGAGANFSVDVSSGWVFIVGTDVTGQSVYAAWNDATINVTTPSAPGSGTRNHRLVIQLQDKFSLGSWTGYQAVPVILQDTGGGTPGAGASAITLSLISIAAGQASVQNQHITDYRRSVGPVKVYKAGDTAKATSTSVADDPDLQLWGLGDNATYAVHGNILYRGGGSVGNEGDLKFTWRTPSGSAGTTGGYSAMRLNVAGNFAGAFRFLWTDVNTAQTQGSAGANDMCLVIDGTYSTGTTRPNNFLVFQWAKNSSPDSTPTTVLTGSYLRADRIAL